MARRHDRARRLPVPADRDPSTAIEAVRINDATMVIGNIRTADGQVQPVRWSAGTTRPPDLLDRDGSGWVAARTLNQAGAVAAAAEPWPGQPRWRLLLWDP